MTDRYEWSSIQRNFLADVGPDVERMIELFANMGVDLTVSFKPLDGFVHPPAPPALVIPIPKKIT